MTMVNPSLRCSQFLVRALSAGSILSAIIGNAGVPAAAETGPDPGTYVVKSWRTIDGLPQNSVTALAQTPDGYLWVGTLGGLARFDGVRFVTYGLPEGLKGLSIRTLLEDGQGGLWIGTLGGGLSHWQNGVISTLTTADGLAHNDVRALAPAEAGALWVGTGRGLQHFGPDGFKQVGEAEGVRGPVIALSPSPTEGLWISVWTVGLFRLQNGRCESVEAAPKSRNLFPWSFLLDTQGALWIGMGNGVVMRRQEGKWTEFNRTNGLPFSYVGWLAQGPSGEIWAGSHAAGPYVFRGGRFHAVPGTDAAVRAIYVSRDGVVWVGTRAGGLCRLARAKVTSYPIGDELRGQVNGLVEGPPGHFWVTTYEGGGLSQGSLDRLTRVVGVPLLNESPFLQTAIRMRDGAIYFGGVKRLLRKEAGAEEIHGTTLEVDPRALCEGADGSLWIGTGEGELRWLVDGVPQTVTNGTFPAAITGLVRGSGAALWLATQGAGLFRWEAGRVQRWSTAGGLPTDNLRTLHLDGEGTLWIGTVGGGLAWLEEGRLHSVNSRQGLRGDTGISQILEDGEGNLWLGGNRGILRVPKRELRAVAAGEAAVVHPLVLDESDGLLSAECTGGYSPAGLRSHSGTLYFSAVRSVVAIDPAQFGSSASPPTVLIEDVVLDGKVLPLRGGTLSVPPGPRELEIRYTAFNYAKPEHIRFRHRLENRKEEWVEAGRERSIRYSMLRPGHYEFHLSAANEDGRWNETGATLAFSVQPFYWQTVWFRVVGALLFMGGGGAAVWGLVRARLRRAMEQERVTVKLRESEQWLNLAADSAGVGLWAWGFMTRQIWATEKARRLYGFAADELIRLKDLTSRLHPDDRDQVVQDSQKCLRDGTDFDHDYRIVLPDGSTRWVRVLAKVFLAPSGGPERMTGVVLDITERKRAEEKVRQLSIALEQSPASVVITDLEGKITYVNRTFSEVSGYTWAESIGQNPRFLKSGESAPVMYQELWACLTSGRMWRGEFHNRKKNGGLYWESAVISPLLDATGKPTHYVGVKQDITELKQAEAELLRERADLAHVARVSTMGELAASLAHELNQPLGAILANAEAAELFLQQNPPALDDLRAILADIRKDDERAGEVIRRMRALLRKHELERQPIEINSLVEDVLQLISGDASLRGVSLSADLRSALPQISGDRIHLQQVLLNLILNGMDAMAGEPRERRRITVRTRLDGEGVVELAVIDAGHGIEPDKLPRLFEPFYTTKPNGMGMGLSIARTIIAAHHGRIWAENNPSGGAAFRIALPVVIEGTKS
jgi:PAS domain S-box-containing protein